MRLNNPRRWCALLLPLLAFVMPLPAHAQLYWTQYVYDAPSDRFSLHRANLDGSSPVELNHDVGLEPQNGLAAYGDKVLWDTEVGEIHAARTDGTLLGVFTDPLPKSIEAEVLGAAYDPVTGATFRGVFQPGGVFGVERVDASGGTAAIPVGEFVDGVALALDPAARKLYYSGLAGGVGVLRRANLDGTGIEDVIPNLPMAHPPSDLALDVPAGKIYFTTEALGVGKIQRANLDGTNVEDVITGIPPALLTVVPEPAGMVLMAAALPLMRRRRR